ncbi:hypothetical protein [Corynebacterium aquilae]|uniref:Uncharacterized protein n=1 Tax=Corynebacterium aquilae DSM 44791 TaxID=1431546 RepID=A0A1L7CHT8_9CORY|nr:hypothetical protein [Corynebacterium aquilae]APT85422.1 hypothetical protein CAQU_10600 [Corynebacterium aquilae DSM 44791]
MKFSKTTVVALFASATLFGSTAVAHADDLTPEEREIVANLQNYYSNYADEATCADLEVDSRNFSDRAEARAFLRGLAAQEHADLAATLRPIAYAEINRVSEAFIDTILDKAVSCGVLKDSAPRGLGNANGTGGSSFSS